MRTALVRFLVIVPRIASPGNGRIPLDFLRLSLDLSRRIAFNTLILSLSSGFKTRTHGDIS
jgi:hypothetical protein